MYGYKITRLTGIPKTVWACKTSVDNYSWKNNNTPDMIEFSLTHAEKRVVKTKSHGDITLEGEAFTCLVGNTEVSSFAEDGVSVEILSIAVRFEGLEYEAKEFDENDLADSSAILLPHFSSVLSDHERSELDRLMHSFIHLYMEKRLSSEIAAASILLDIISRLDKAARRTTASKKEKYVNYYVMKADSIISRRYTEKLTLKKIADELGITPCYLSAIYKASTGVGFSDRLFEKRMLKAEELLLSTKLTVSEIAQSVGFEDDSHLRRRFKQYFGTSIKEYRCINNEQTLYHKKPERDNEI